MLSQANKACRWWSTYDRSLRFTIVFQYLIDLFTLQHAITGSSKQSGERPVRGRTAVTHTASIMCRASLAFKELVRQLWVEKLPIVREVEDEMEEEVSSSEER